MRSEKSGGSLGWLLRGIATASIALTLWVGDSGGARAEAKEIALLNVSYDPTRELYEDINAKFAAQWKSRSGDSLKIQ